MKKSLKVTIIAVLAALLAGIGALFVGCTNDAEGITISGSSSVTPIMEKLAAAYEKENNVRITINMSSSGAGISDTLNDLNDFGMVSRNLKAEETGLTSANLCMDGIALIVSKTSSVTNVSKESVKALFTNGTAIPDTDITAAIGRDASSGTRSAFDELMGIESEYNSSVATLAETGNVIESIESSDNSIGYISYGSLTDRVKAVKLDRIECASQNIINGVYALQRPFVIVIKEGKALSEAAKKFYDYIMSAEAQSIISSNGYISVK